MPIEIYGRALKLLESIGETYKNITFLPNEERIESGYSEVFNLGKFDSMLTFLDVTEIAKIPIEMNFTELQEYVAEDTEEEIDGVNTIHAYSIVNATGGAFKIEYDGDQTGALDYDISAEDLKVAIVGLKVEWESADITVIKVDADNYTVEFDHTLGLIPDPTFDITTLTQSEDLKLEVIIQVEDPESEEWYDVKYGPEFCQYNVEYIGTHYFNVVTVAVQQSVRIPVDGENYRIKYNITPESSIEFSVSGTLKKR